ncbi:uncharacterized protein PAC_07742 [Phialocephala subalpina]|uniref:FAD-binding domain-containing protein n=1 Tax=Phialocephala subalpina TaxID=576137 RepID=A0A1L7WYL0_9HELO|nr:uncharacterized protein PAC_07742 [Phialocephala subalpina]
MAGNTIATDFVIVGGGPVGLFMSANLSNMAAPIGPIRHLLFERHPGTAIQPKTIDTNQRILGCHPKKHIERVGWYICIGQEDLVPKGPSKHPRGTEILRRYCEGGGLYKERWASLSPSRYSGCSQRQTEPLVHRCTRELAGPETKIKFSTEVAKIIPAEHAGGLSCVILRDGTTVKTKCVVVADGGRSCSDTLSVKVEGRHDVIDMVNAHFVAPGLYSHLTKLGGGKGHNATQNLLSFFVNPDMKTSRAR